MHKASLQLQCVGLCSYLIGEKWKEMDVGASELMEMNETKVSVCRLGRLLRLQSRLIHTSGLSPAAASSWLATLFSWWKLSLILLASLYWGEKKYSNKYPSAAVVFTLKNLMSNCRGRERK